LHTRVGDPEGVNSPL
jgi:hypothetical protein